MDPSLSSLLAEARHTLSDPRGGLRRVLALDPPLSARWLGLAVTAILSTILSHFSLALIPLAEQDALVSMMQSPLRTALLQGGLLAVLVYLIYWAGRARGGRGSLPDVLLAMVWLQVLMLGLQVIQLAVQVLLPPFAGVVNLVAFALFLWLLTNFVAEVHGFRSLILVFGALVLGIVLLAILLSIILMAFLGGPVVGA